MRYASVIAMGEPDSACGWPWAQLTWESLGGRLYKLYKKMHY